MNRSNPGMRMRQRRLELNKTLEEVGKAAGVTRATMSRYESGTISNIPNEKLEAIAKCLRVPPSYLLGWEDFLSEEEVHALNMRLRPLGVKILLVNEEDPDWAVLYNEVHYPRADVLELYDIVQAAPDTELCEMIDGYFNSIEARRNSPPHVIPIRVPVYGTIPAGVPMEAVEDIDDYEELDPRKFSPGHEYIALKVRGDSMYPKYLDGDVVILQVQETCESYDDCAVYVNGYDATLKTVIKNGDESITLKPINPNYAPTTYREGDEPVRILGIVKELRRTI